ncbi:MAG: heavy-metal-associated domain-containing protein [Muribaculaceae bacterium]
MKRFLFAIIAVVTASGLAVANAKDAKVDTLCVTTTPQMHCANCEKKIKSNIRFVKGVKKIQTSVPLQKVTIVYDPDKSDYKAIETAFAKIGYTIKPVSSETVSDNNN